MEAKLERREGSRLRPSTAAELAGARWNRPATAKAKRGSCRPREREREERGRREWFDRTEPVRVDLVQPSNQGPKCNFKKVLTSNQI